MFNRLRFAHALASGAYSPFPLRSPKRRAATDSFTVKIAEKQQALSDPIDEAMQHFLDVGSECRSSDRPQYALFGACRTMRTSTSPITTFHLTIGDTRFHFDCAALGSCAMLGKTTRDVSLTSAVSAITGDSSSTSGDQLNLTIGNGGLQPGQIVRFKIALAVDAGLNHLRPSRLRTSCST